MTTAGRSLFAALTGLPCPLCGERALDRAASAAPAPVRCAACGESVEALGEVTVLTDRERRWGGCCAGFRRHVLRWRDRDGKDGETRFETWAQDHLRLRPDDRVSLLFALGDLAARRRPPMPLIVANHTTGEAWALVGAHPVQTLR